MNKIPVRKTRRPSGEAERPPIRRMERPAGVTGAIVRTVLAGSETSLRRFNDYLVLLHVAAGLWLLAFCVEDISAGGPSRPMIIPIVGGYMSASIVFYTVLKERSPALLVWINGLSDVIFIVAAHRLAFVSLFGLGPDLTVVLLVAAVSLSYAATGDARLVLAMTSIVTVFFGLAFASPATGYPALDLRSVGLLVLVAAGSMLAWKMARFVRRKSLSACIRTLERVDAAVTDGRMSRLAPSGRVAH